MGNDRLTIALAGNPNAGKSTIFNALTGARQHTGNWPGKTIEKKAGIFQHDGYEFEIVDLPGTYSLSAYSMEEKVARDFLMDERPPLIVNVLDASNLERNLYLTAQILETGVPVILVLNMMDVAASRNITINGAELSRRLHGLPVLTMTASSGTGLEELKQTMVSVVRQHRNTPDLHPLNC